MEGFIEELEGGIAAVFEGEEYQSRMQDIQEELEQQQREGLSAIGKEARESDIALVSTPSGSSLVPMRDDEVLEPEEFKKLPEERSEERRVGKGSAGAARGAGDDGAPHSAMAKVGRRELARRA